MQELTGVIRLLANGKVVAPDGVSVELFKITFNCDLALRRRLHDIAVCMWRGRGAAAVEICHYHPAPAAFPAGVDPNRGSEETVRSPGKTVRSPGVL